MSRSRPALEGVQRWQPAFLSGPFQPLPSTEEKCARVRCSARCPIPRNKLPASPAVCAEEVDGILLDGIWRADGSWFLQLVAHHPSVLAFVGLDAIPVRSGNQNQDFSASG